jgi:hypothetical protein
MAVLAGAQALAEVAPGYRNATAGGQLRHGVYGRIEVRNAAPPPTIYKQPVVAKQARIQRPVAREPVYLYVPPGQVRKWERHCAKWSACDQPVMFVRMDASPSRWGKWRLQREQVAWQDRTFD